MARIQISKDLSGRIIVSFPYDPLLVSRIKTIGGRRWHPVEKHWSFQPTLPSPLAGEGGGEGYNFEDLRRELLSRKYSYKTIKGYLYYNRDFINYAGKTPSEIKDEDIKNYLVYLSEEKGAATSTLNQAINALRFYYGSMLKKKFVYEVKRPRKECCEPR